jgi:hypothetical protein
MAMGLSPPTMRLITARGYQYADSCISRVRPHIAFNNKHSYDQRTSVTLTGFGVKLLFENVLMLLG